MENVKRFFIYMVLVSLALQNFAFRMEAYAFSSGLVVINEIAWAGTTDYSNDEWIELYNITSQPIDLTGWVIVDDGVDSYVLSGEIAAHGYYLIEDSEEVVGNFAASAIIGLSLANAGDSLVLKDSSGNVIDTVNGNGGAWYAGDGISKVSMERIDPSVTPDSANNWANSTKTNGSVGRSGSLILGTPGSANSSFTGGSEVDFISTSTNFNTGDTFTVNVRAEKVIDLYAYGFEVKYDPNVLSFVSAIENDFLKGGSTSTSFNYSLENDQEGTLIIGNARLINPPNGVDGSGDLFALQFKVVGTEGSSSSINFGPTSFLADSNTDIPAQMNSLTISVGEVSSESISNLTAKEGLERYSLKLSWTAPSLGAEKYIIKRKSPNGNYVIIAEVTENSFTDNDDVEGAGNIIPNIEYTYQVFSVKNGITSLPVTVDIIETRGLIGDNNRSGRVDGRDIEKLARAYGSGFGDEEYNPLADTNFDGVIDGSDLIDVGANFGKKI